MPLLPPGDSTATGKKLPPLGLGRAGRTARGRARVEPAQPVALEAALPARHCSAADAHLADNLRLGELSGAEQLAPPPTGAPPSAHA